MPSSADVVSRSIVPVLGARHGSQDPDIPQSLMDLVAWCGEGVLTPNQVHAFLRDDPSRPRRRAVGLLLRTLERQHYVATACHVLDDRRPSTALPQGGNEPNREPSNAAPRVLETDISFAEAALHASTSSGSFKATCFPHLDLAAIRIDGFESQIPSALEQAGYVFIDVERIGEEPSAEGARIRIVGTTSAGGDRVPSQEADPHDGAIEGRVTGLSASLSFFWTDAAPPSSASAAPVLEHGSVVGFMCPQVDPAVLEGCPSLVPSTYATVVKAAYLKDLIAASLAHDEG